MVDNSNNQNNLCPIVIYSELNLIHEILAQVYPNRQLKRLNTNEFAFQKGQMIYVVDLTTRASKPNTIERFIKFSALHQIIFLTLHDCHDEMHTVIRVPFSYKDLVEAIDRLSLNNHVLQISDNAFLNERTMDLIKVSGKALTEIKLTRVECNILKCLLQSAHNNFAVDEETLLREVFGYESSKVTTNTVKTHICRLRQKLGKDVICSTEFGYVLG